jgi:DHA1 family multidrug resistance protein-like MFS transporter
VMPLYAAELGALVSQVGLIVATYSYVAALLLIPFGMLSDRLGRHKFLVASLVISTLAPLLYPLATNPQQLIFVRAIHGLALAVFLPAAIALVIDLTPAAQRGGAIGWYTASFQSGLMAGPITGGFLLNHFGFEAAFYGCAAVSVAGLVFILCRLGAIAHRPIARLAGASSWNWIKQTLVFASLLTPLFVAIGSGTIAAYIPLYGRGFGMSEVHAGLIITALYASSALLRAPAGRLSDRLGRKPMIICGLAVSAVAAALMSQFHGLSELVIAAIFFGVGMGLAMPAGIALVADLSPAADTGLSMGIFACLFQVGLAVGATTMGFVAEMSNFETMFMACGSSLAFGLLIILGLMRSP